MEKQINESTFVRIGKNIITIAQDDWKQSGNFSNVHITIEDLKKIIELSENGGK